MAGCIIAAACTRERSEPRPRPLQSSTAAPVAAPPVNVAATPSVTPPRAPRVGKLTPSKLPATALVAPAPAAILAPRTPAARATSPSFFQQYGINPTVDTEEEARSSFFLTNENPSYDLARSYLYRGVLPEPDTVRVEELINHFDYGYGATAEPIHVEAELFPSKLRPGFHVLRLALKAQELTPSERSPANLVFVVDVSGSMEAPDRLGLLKRGLRQLVSKLQPADRIALVTYGAEAKVKLPFTGPADAPQILAAIDALAPEGSSDVQAGMVLGYSTARSGFRPEARNRLILCTDGVADNGVTTTHPIFGRVRDEAAGGIALSVVGFGMGSTRDVLMEKLAERGGGPFAIVDRPMQVAAALMENLTGASQWVARDLSLQLELDAAAVARYRLLGYENRPPGPQAPDIGMPATADLGAGQAATVVYEVELRPGEGALGILRARYLDPVSASVKSIEKGFGRESIRAGAEEIAPATRLAWIAARFAEKLRGTYWSQSDPYRALLEEWNALPSSWKTNPDILELRALIEKSAALDKRGELTIRLQPID